MKDRRERDRRYNQSDKGRARSLRYYHRNWQRINYARSRRRLRARIDVKREILKHGGYFRGVYVPGEEA